MCVFLILEFSLCPVPPLFVIEFLHRIVDVFTEYFGDCSEQKIKENYVTVYEVYTNVQCTCKIVLCHSLCMYTCLYIVPCPC